MRLGVPIVGADAIAWAQDMRRWIARSWDSLTFKGIGENAAEDGILLWDQAGYPVVSKGGVFRQIVLADGYAMFTQDNTITAALANTAYAIEWDAAVVSDGITLAGTPATRITFTNGGLYHITFSAEIESTSASVVDLRFWPRINGVDAAGSTMVCSLHNNGATMVTSRSAVFSMSAGDYLEAMWATDATTGQLTAHAATAYAPASPSATLAIMRIHQ